jgi:hypothetical protein
MALGKNLEQFCDTYRRPLTITRQGDRIFAEFNNISGELTGEKTRENGLLLIANADGIIEEYKFLTAEGPAHSMDNYLFVKNAMAAPFFRSWLRGAGNVKFSTPKIKRDWDYYVMPFLPEGAKKYESIVSIFLGLLQMGAKIVGDFIPSLVIMFFFLPCFVLPSHFLSKPKYERIRTEIVARQKPEPQDNIWKYAWAKHIYVIFPALPIALALWFVVLFSGIIRFNMSSMNTLWLVTSAVTFIIYIIVERKAYGKLKSLWNESRCIFCFAYGVIAPIDMQRYESTSVETTTTTKYEDGAKVGTEVKDDTTTTTTKVTTWKCRLCQKTWDDIQTHSSTVTKVR